MEELLIVRPEIALDQFLPIFVESTLVLVFGVGYAAVITLAKMGYFSKKWMPVGYLFTSCTISPCLFKVTISH